MSEHQDGEVPADDASAFFSDPTNVAEFNAQPKESGRSNVPDGKYVVFVDEMSFKRGGQKNELMLKWNMLALTPEQHNGRRIWKSSKCVRGDAMKYLKQELHAAGLPVDNPEQIPQLVKQLHGFVLEITVKTKPAEPATATTPARDAFTSVYIDRMIAKDGDEQWKPAIEYVRKKKAEASSFDFGSSGGVTDAPAGGAAAGGHVPGQV